MINYRSLRKLSWILFGLMWIPFTGIFIGMIGLPSGGYEWIDLPLITRISLILTGVFAGSSMLLLIGIPIFTWLQGRSLQSNGQPAHAKVLKVWDTGTTINQNPMVGMLLEVYPPGGVAFQAETEQVISRLQAPWFQPGMEVAVRYDPRTHAITLSDDPSS